MKILLLGAGGQLGSQLQFSLSPLAELNSFNHKQLDFSDLTNLRDIICKHNPNFVVNAAAYTKVDLAEKEKEQAFLVNAQAVKVLAEACLQINACLIHYSTDYVFDGQKDSAYTEEDVVNPINIYGASKLQGEDYIREINCNHLIFRTSWVYSLFNHNFFTTILGLAAQNDKLEIVTDKGIPNSTNLMANITALCIYKILLNKVNIKDIKGVFNLSASGYSTWFEYAKLIIQSAHKCDFPLKTQIDKIYSIEASKYITAAKRPKNSLLNNKKLATTFNLKIPDWKDDVIRLINMYCLKVNNSLL